MAAQQQSLLNVQSNLAGSMVDVQSNLAGSMVDVQSNLAGVVTNVEKNVLQKLNELEMKLYLEQELKEKQEKQEKELYDAQLTLLPDLEAKGSLVNDGTGLKPKVFAEFGTSSRGICLNKYGDMLSIIDNKLVIIRQGDPTDANYSKLTGTNKYRVLVSETDLFSFDPIDSGLNGSPTGTNDKLINAVVIRHYPAGTISTGSAAVTKIFAATGYCVYVWDYDDSNKYNAYFSPLSNGRIIVNRITCGLDTHFDYGPVGHYAHALLFNKAGDLHISSGSFANLDIDNNGNLTDERSTVKYLEDASIKAFFANEEDHIYKYDSNDLMLLARGLRNACVLGLDENDVVWCTNMGFDSVNISGIETETGEILWNSNPADTIYELKRENSKLKYGYPFAFHSATELIVDGVHKPKNSIILIKTSTENELDALGRPIGPRKNPFSKQDIEDPHKFIQHANITLDKSSSPLGLVFNYADKINPSKLIYDGLSDQRLVKEKTVTGEFGLIALKGSWNKLKGSGGAGFKVVSFSKNSDSVKDFYTHISFSTGFDDYSGLNDLGQLTNNLIAPTVYRPSHIVLLKDGNICVGSDYRWMTQPNHGQTFVVLYN